MKIEYAHGCLQNDAITWNKYSFHVRHSLSTTQLRVKNTGEHEVTDTYRDSSLFFRKAYISVFIPYNGGGEHDED